MASQAQKNCNPLQGFSWEQLNYLYGELPPGSSLRSNVAIQLSVLQQIEQQQIRAIGVPERTE